MHMHIPHTNRQNALPHPGNLMPHPGWLPGPQAPKLVPWARGAAAEPEFGRPLPGKLWCERETSPPAPPGQEAQSHGGGGGLLPPGRPQGCGGASPTGAPRALQEKR